MQKSIDPRESLNIPPFIMRNSAITATTVIRQRTNVRLSLAGLPTNSNKQKIAMRRAIGTIGTADSCNLKKDNPKYKPRAKEKMGAQISWCRSGRVELAF